MMALAPSYLGLMSRLLRSKQSDSADLPVGHMYLVVGLLIQCEHYATSNLYEVVQDVRDAGDDGPMAASHTNAEWLAKIETLRFRNLLRRASIKLMNAIDTATRRKPIQMLTPGEPAGKWGGYLSGHVIDHEASAKVSDEQAAAGLETHTIFQAKLNILTGSSGVYPTPKGCHFFINLADKKLGSAIKAVQKQAESLTYHVMTWAKDCGIRMGNSLRHDVEYYLYVRKAPPNIVAGNICAFDPRG
eukprot:jgi/Tetstr1/428198/TSEL_001819.t1